MTAPPRPPPSNHAPHSSSLQHTSLLPQLRSFAHAIPFAWYTLPHLLLHSVGLCLLHLTENNQASLRKREGKGRKFKGRVASGLVGFRAQDLWSVLPPQGLHPAFSLSFHLLPRVGGRSRPESPSGSRARVKRTTSISVSPQRPRVHPGPILEPITVSGNTGVIGSGPSHMNSTVQEGKFPNRLNLLSAWQPAEEARAAPARAAPAGAPAAW